MIRLFVNSPLSPARLNPGEEQSHYLLHVMRVKAGDSLLLFNGQDGEWQAEVAEVKKHSLTLQILHKTRDQAPEQGLRLLFAPIKRGHGDMVVEKATELGATRLSPVITQHTVVGRVPLDRFKAIATEAAEQCERLSVPQVDEPQKLADILRNWNDTPLLFCAEAGQAKLITDALQDIKAGPVALLTGPEGGFSAEEFALLRAQKFIVPVHLGSRILRADTAAIAALAIVQATIGDWRNADRNATAHTV